MSCKIDIEIPNIVTCSCHKNIYNIFSLDNCSVAVNYLIFDKKRKTILYHGSSRPCGYNNNKTSMHAEELAINLCRNHHRERHLRILIWRWNKKGELKSAFCCNACSSLANKYDYEKKILTIKNNKHISAIVENPSLSLAYKIKYNQI